MQFCICSDENRQNRRLFMNAVNDKKIEQQQRSSISIWKIQIAAITDLCILCMPAPNYSVKWKIIFSFRMKKIKALKTIFKFKLCEYTKKIQIKTIIFCAPVLVQEGVVEQKQHNFLYILWTIFYLLFFGQSLPLFRVYVVPCCTECVHGKACQRGFSSNIMLHLNIEKYCCAMLSCCCVWMCFFFFCNKNSKCNKDDWRLESVEVYLNISNVFMNILQISNIFVC